MKKNGSLGYWCKTLLEIVLKVLGCLYLERACSQQMIGTVIRVRGDGQGVKFFFERKLFLPFPVSQYTEDYSPATNWSQLKDDHLNDGTAGAGGTGGSGRTGATAGTGGTGGADETGNTGPPVAPRINATESP